MYSALHFAECFRFRGDNVSLSCDVMIFVGPFCDFFVGIVWYFFLRGPKLTRKEGTPSGRVWLRVNCFKDSLEISRSL